MKTWLYKLGCLCLLGAGMSAYADPAGSPSSEVAEQHNKRAADTADVDVRPGEKGMKWWHDAKYGMFITWNPTSQTGKELGWTRRSKHNPWPDSSTIPAEEYDKLFQTFNPVKFDAKEWVKVIKASGARYVVFVTNHLDGYCMFDTQHASNRITSPQSLFKRDIAGEMAKELRKAGIDLVWYYCVTDWADPDFNAPTYQAYVDRHKAQIRDLMTNYGPVKGMWFDGVAIDHRQCDFADLGRMAYKLQPGIIFNGRDYGVKEQRLWKFDLERPWETCMTLGDQWSWMPNDQIKPLETCVEYLARCAGGNGNYLLNMAPLADGSFEKRQADRFLELGAWLEKNGESIYGTRGGPFKPSTACVSTRKGNKVYVHILDWEDETIRLGAIPRKVKSAKILGGGQKVTFKQGKDGITLSVPKEQRQPMNTVVVLTLDGSAMDVKPVEAVTGSLTFMKPIKVSSTMSNAPEEYGPQFLVDGDPASRWISEKTDDWAEIDLGKPCTFNRASLHEYHSRVLDFELQAQRGEQWETFHKGTGVGKKLMMDFQPVTAQKVRLKINRAHAGVHLGEFRLFAPQQ